MTDFSPEFCRKPPLRRPSSKSLPRLHFRYDVPHISLCAGLLTPRKVLTVGLPVHSVALVFVVCVLRFDGESPLLYFQF